MFIWAYRRQIGKQVYLRFHFFRQEWIVCYDFIKFSEQNWFRRSKRKKKFKRNNTKVRLFQVHIMYYIWGWNIEFIFFAHSEKQCLQQSKNLQRFCIRSLLLPFQEENNPKIMFNAINIVYNNSSQKIYSRKKALRNNQNCVIIVRSIQNQILNCIQKNILNCRLELLRLRFFLQLHCIH